jgi:hypothetical protein
VRDFRKWWSRLTYDQLVKAGWEVVKFVLLLFLR